MSSAGVLRRFAVAGAVVLASIAAAASPASAHVDIVSTDPADGSVLTTSPERITLTFSEGVDPQLTQVDLRTASGTAVPLGEMTFDGDGHEVVVAVPALARDAYRLTYVVHDPIDLHRTSGSIVFGVGTSPQSTGGEDARGPQLLGSLAEWLARGGLALVLGGLLMVALVRRCPPLTRSRAASIATSLRVASIGAVLVVVGGLAAVVLQIVEIGGPVGSTAWRVLSTSDFGRRFVASAVVGGGLVQYLRVVRPLLVDHEVGAGRPADVAEAGAAVAATVLVVLAAISAHARIGGSFAAGVALRAVHLAAMGLWVGGLVVLVALRRRTTPWERATLLRAFSPVALVSVAVTIVSGLLLTGREVRSVTALLSTGFGGVLLVKLLVLGVALGLGARHASAVAHGRHLGARTVAAEAAAVLVVVLGGAAMATAVPAVGERFEPVAAVPETQVSQKVDDLLVRLTIGPSRPGRNLVRLELIDSRRPAPAPAVSARVVITDAAGSSVSTAGGPPVDGVIELPAVDIAAPGPLQVRVEVDRPSRPVVPVDLSWSVEAAPAVRAPTVLSDAPLAPWCLGAAAAVSVIAVIAWSRRRRIRSDGGVVLPIEGSGPQRTRGAPRMPA